MQNSFFFLKSLQNPNLCFKIHFGYKSATQR